jgi:hypothetical protein
MAHTLPELADLNSRLLSEVASHKSELDLLEVEVARHKAKLAQLEADAAQLKKQVGLLKLASPRLPESQNEGGNAATHAALSGSKHGRSSLDEREDSEDAASSSSDDPDNFSIASADSHVSDYYTTIRVVGHHFRKGANPPFVKFLVLYEPPKHKRRDNRKDWRYNPSWQGPTYLQENEHLQAYMSALRRTNRAEYKKVMAAWHRQVAEVEAEDALARKRSKKAVKARRGSRAAGARS